MQRNLSSFDIYIIVSELQELVDSLIEKIYQISRDEILIRVKNIQTKEKNDIYIRNGDFLSITDKDFEKPKSPSVFAMTLRKYLSNGRITSITQHEFDRIIVIKITKKQEEYKLFIEFFSDGNIILVDPAGKIIIPMIRQSWAHRKVSGRQDYVFPPSQINPFSLDEEKLKKLFKQSSSDIVRTLAVNVNLSGAIAEEICLRGNIDKKTKAEEVNDKIVSEIFASLKGFISIFKEGEFSPVLVKKECEFVDILPFKFESYKEVEFEKIDSFSKGLNVFIKEKPASIIKKESKVDKALGKLDRQLKMQKEAVVRLEKEIIEKKREGDLIYLHYQEIEQLLNEIINVLDLKDKTDDIKKINNLDIVKKFNPEQNLLILNLKDTKNEIFEVKLSFRMSVSQNAEKAYADNKKLKSKLAGAKKSIEKTYELIEKIKKNKKTEDAAEIKNPVKKEKTFWFERYRWFISSNGNLVVGGKDAKTNDLIVKKYLKEGDRYSHADVQGAPSIIIKSKDALGNKKEIDEKTLEEACIFAASFSKAWKQFAEAQAYWVLPEQVSKTAQSGEFVPHGAFIIRGKRNYHRCKLELAVGEIVIDDAKKIMCGPVSAVKKHCKKYIIFEPGAVKKMDMVKKIAKVFDVGTDNVDRVLPAGGMQIVGSFGVNL
jgi:predicted ribosome quality control (RQC) complex YloA/Tae2 family protein